MKWWNIPVLHFRPSQILNLRDFYQFCRENPKILFTFSNSSFPDKRAAVGALWYRSKLFEKRSVVSPILFTFSNRLKGLIHIFRVCAFIILYKTRTDAENDIALRGMQKGQTYIKRLHFYIQICIWKLPHVPKLDGFICSELKPK